MQSVNENINAETINNEIRVIVFIPTYNDFKNLQNIVNEVHEHHPSYEILVIDDGSLESKKLPDDCYSVRLPVNLGLGVLTNIAFDFALHNEYDIMIRLDGDGQHPVSSIGDLIDNIKGGSDIAIGSRINRNGGMSPIKALSRFARAYISLISKLMLRASLPCDLNSGFIAMNEKAMRVVNTIDLDRYPEPQIIIIGASNKLCIKEVPVMQNTRTEGKSSLNVFQAFRLLYRVSVYALLTVTGGYK